MRRAAIHTLGCKVNQYDSDVIMGLLQEAGYEKVDFESDADVYIINTCAVTNEAERKSRQLVRRIAGRVPAARVVVVGCYAQKSPEQVGSIEGVDLVIGTQDHDRIVDLINGIMDERRTDVLDAVREEITSVYSDPQLIRKGDRTRANIKIQDGCDRFCTYCIIPKVRGPIRSRPVEDCLKEISRMACLGVREAVLTGIHMASYGMDIDGTCHLAEVLEHADRIDGIDRIRLSSVEPPLLNDDFVSRIARLHKLCPQFHVALQSGSDAVLRRMGRRYTAEAYRKGIELLRSTIPDAAVTTDIIVGFPGETEALFRESLEFVESIGFSKIHVFPFSVREGTPAQRMDGQVSKAEKHSRALRMIELGETLHRRFLQSKIGYELSVLFEERDSAGMNWGYSREYIRVMCADPEIRSGDILPCTAESIREDCLIVSAVSRT